MIGWQRMTLNLNALCATCNAMLPRGTEGAVAIINHRTRQFDPRITLCVTCLEELSHEQRSHQDG